jgi:D-3-phosphoglycerate dehydrogenase
MYKLVITDYWFKSPDIEKSILDPLGCDVIAAHCRTPEEISALVADADCVLTGFAPVNAQVIAAMKKTRGIVRYGIGVDNIDLEAAAKRGIPVCNVPDYCIDEVADHALSMILALNRQLFPHCEAIRRGVWKLVVPVEQVRVLRDMTVGLVAFGRIGRAVAARLQPFKCRVCAFDPLADAAEITQLGCHAMGFDDLLAASDLVSLHCPSTPKTRGLIDSRALAHMKRGSLLVNTSRGDLVKAEDLIAALKTGHIAGAALDVTHPEPISKDSPLLKMSNVILTPHIASSSVKAEHTLRTSAATAAARVLRGEKLLNVVNGVV